VTIRSIIRTGFPQIRGRPPGLLSKTRSRGWFYQRRVAKWSSIVSRRGLDTDYWCSLKGIFSGDGATPQIRNDRRR
jgi:hypothetical protein